MGPRTRKEFLKYRKHRKQKDESVCDFCNISKNSAQFVEQTTNFQVIKNAYPYTVWDSISVTDHLMIIPKRHIENLSDLPNSDKVEFVDLIAKYENKGYNIYARSPHSIVKTIPHQHTHLIKPVGRAKKFLLMMKKPYLTIAK